MNKADRKKNLRKLAHMMNSQNISPIPVIDSLINCFELVITPEENEFLLDMGTEPRSRDELLALSGMDEEKFTPFLDGMLKKGLVHTKRVEGDGKEYYLTPILVGWFEIYLSDGDESPVKMEFAQRVEKLLKAYGRLNVPPLNRLINLYQRKTSKPNKTIALIDPGKSRQVDINEKLKGGPSTVMLTGTINELIEKYGDEGNIALMHCFCRQWHSMTGHDCRFNMPPESCLALGEYTEYIVENGIGRYISRDEALGLIRELQEKGAVHTVFYDSEDINKPEMGICNCCWDCCGVHGSYNRGRTGLNLLSEYLAEIPDPGVCTGCGRCVRFCPTGAIVLADKKAVVDSSLCIGCGQCSFQCSFGAVEMVREKRHVLLPYIKKSKSRLLKKK